MKTSYELQACQDGSFTLKDTRTDQSMHSRIGPMTEAKLVFIENSRLMEELRQPDSQPLVIHDIGMGIAANSIAAIDTWLQVETMRELHLVSFETDLDGIRTALTQSDRFDFLTPYKDVLDTLLREKKVSFSEGNLQGLSWTLFEGDFFQSLPQAPRADLVFFDLYSPKHSPLLWGLRTFREIAAGASERGLRLVTYSAATPVRSALLLAGFELGSGIPTSSKYETTEATIAPRRTRKPVNPSWLTKWLSSPDPFPYDEKPTTPDQMTDLTRRHQVLESLKKLPQFKILSLILFLSLSLAHASERLTWKQCLEQTLRGNSELKAAEETLQASHFSSRAAFNTFLPQISASINSSQGSIAQGTTGTTAISPSGSTQSSVSATVSASQNLFNGLQDQAKLDQTAAQVRFQKASLQSVQSKVSYDLKSAHAGLLFAERSIQLQQQILNRREANKKLVELRFESGRENKGSVLLSEAYFNQARYELLQAKNGVSVAQAQLARVLGRDEDTDLLVDEDLPLEEPEVQPKFRELALLTPDHLQSTAQEQVADAAVMSARSGFFPSLNLNFTQGRSGTQWFPQNDRWSIGASLSLPLFNGGRDLYGTKSAISSRVAATESRQNLDRQLLTKLRQAYTTYIESVEKLKVDRSFREAASKRAEIARSKYNNGLMSFEDWDQIENDLIVREKAVLQSQRDRTLAEANWQQAQGKGALSSP